MIIACLIIVVGLVGLFIGLTFAHRMLRADFARLEMERDAAHGEMLYHFHFAHRIAKENIALFELNKVLVARLLSEKNEYDSADWWKNGEERF